MINLQRLVKKEAGIIVNNMQKEQGKGHKLSLKNAKQSCFYWALKVRLSSNVADEDTICEVSS